MIKTGRMTIEEVPTSQPPSLENPFVGEILGKYAPGTAESQPPSLENPFVGELGMNWDASDWEGLNLQAWRIPLWVILFVTTVFMLK